MQEICPLPWVACRGEVQFCHGKYVASLRPQDDPTAPCPPVARWPRDVPATAADHRGMDRLRALNEQDGFFSRADALAEGYDDRTIQRTIRSGTWRRVRTGAYSFTDLWPATDEELPPHPGARGRAQAQRTMSRSATHRQRTSMACGPGESTCRTCT